MCHGVACQQEVCCAWRGSWGKVLPAGELVGFDLAKDDAVQVVVSFEGFPINLRFDIACTYQGVPGFNLWPFAERLDDKKHPNAPECGHEIPGCVIGGTRAKTPSLVMAILFPRMDGSIEKRSDLCSGPLNA